TNIAQLEILNSVFSQNHGTNTSSTAGAVYVAAYADATIVNCTFYANISAFGAVSFYNNGSTASINIYNSIFNANKKSSSNADAADVKAKNLANLSLRYNLLQQDYTGYSNVSTNNLIVNANPTNLFLSTTITDANFLKLIEGTATEKGSNNYAATYGLTTDLAGDLRLKHTNIDLGAYEFQGTLPVALESFIAKKVNQSSQLTWKVATEVDNDRFVIERSTDGVKFNSISSIASKGNTQKSVTYSYTDFSPQNGINYYRLSQFDKDGTLKLLGTQAVSFNFNEIEVSVYPNPVSDVLKLNLNNYTGAFSVKTVSLLGQILSSKHFKNANGEEKFLDVRNLSAGNYILLVQTKTKTYPVKIKIVR
ncbi:MAG: T9SS type A sorting domain-containing protein, partial [Chitinophagaceae bacterium]